MSDDLIDIEIDGQALKARKGAMVIQVADEAGIRIPRFCYHDRLSVAANCRMCLVEVERAPKPLPACATPVMPGMKVKTRSAYAIKAQKSVMEFLLINHPLDCPICDQGGECELQDLAMGYGRDVSRFTERKRVVEDKNLGPLIATDMTRCIHCTRCVRFGEEIGGMPEMGATGRGENVRIGTFIEQAVTSELSGNVIDLCPVGALTSKPFRFRARAWEMQQREGIAPHDAVGSNVHVHVGRGRVMRVVPRENDAVNEVWLSDRDRFSYEGLYSEDRLTAPMVKRSGEWQTVSWEEALSVAAEGLRAVASGHGPSAIGALASPSATLQEHFLLQRVVRGLGSSNVDHRLREADFSDQASAAAFPGFGIELRELERADAVLLIGSWSRKEHPLVNHRLRKASLRGARIMVVNAVDHEFNMRIHQRLVAGPGAMPGVLAAIAGALGVAVAGADTSEAAAGIASALRDAERPVILLGPGVAAHPRAATLRGLAAAISGASGATLGVLTDGANAAGAWLAGAVPHRGPGGRALAEPGLDARAMLEQPRKAYVLLGVEPELDCWDGAAARAALGQAELVIGLTAWRGPAVDAHADVLLPIAAFAENAGTLVSGEGRWQSFAPAVKPPGEARPAWRVLRVLGNLLELDGFQQQSEAEIEDEVRGLAADAVGGAGQWTPGDGAAPSSGAGGVMRIGEVPLYAVDALVRRAPALQRTPDADFAGAELAPDVAADIGLEGEGRVTVKAGAGAVTLNARATAAVAPGCVRIAAGVVETIDLGPSYGAVTVERA